MLTPSPEVTGASDLVVLVDRKEADGFVSFGNRGSRFVGPYEGGIGANLNSVLGFYERFGIRFIGATQIDELKLFEATFDKPLGTVSVIKTFGTVEPIFCRRIWLILV